MDKWIPPKPTPENVAGREGYLAYWQGKPVSDNPYSRITQPMKRFAWNIGWRIAQLEDGNANAS